MRTLAGISFQRGAENVCPLPIIPLCLSREEKRKLHGDVQIALAKKSKKCFLCDEILVAGAVPLCKAARNGELTGKNIVHCLKYRVVELTHKRWDGYL